jgi:hypothetical protein
MGTWWEQIQNLGNPLGTSWEHDEPDLWSKIPLFGSLEISHNWQIVPLSGLDIMQMHTFSLFLPSWSETWGWSHPSLKGCTAKGLYTLYIVAKRISETQIFVPNSLFNHPKW